MNNYFLNVYVFDKVEPHSYEFVGYDAVVHAMHALVQCIDVVEMEILEVGGNVVYRQEVGNDCR